VVAIFDRYETQQILVRAISTGSLGNMPILPPVLESMNPILLFPRVIKDTYESALKTPNRLPPHYAI